MITQDQWVLQIIEKGNSLEFIQNPPPFFGVRVTSLPRNSLAKAALLQEVQDLLRKGAAEIVPENQNQAGFYCTFF